MLNILILTVVLVPVLFILIPVLMGVLVHGLQNLRAGADKRFAVAALPFEVDSKHTEPLLRRAIGFASTVESAEAKEFVRKAQRVLNERRPQALMDLRAFQMQLRRQYRL